MTDDNYNQLAKEFMGLWQKQMASMVGDKDLIQSMLDSLETMKMPNVTAKTTTTTHASEPDAANTAELAFRLAMCEQRIATLEQQLAAKTTPQKATPRPAQTRKKTK